MSNCLFCKFVRKEIPTRVVFEDDSCFEDINPKAPVHVLLIPKKHIVSIDTMSPEDETTLGHLTLVSRQIAQEKEGGSIRLPRRHQHGTRRWPVCVPHPPASARRPPNGLATGIVDRLPPPRLIASGYIAIFSRDSVRELLGV